MRFRGLSLLVVFVCALFLSSPASAQQRHVVSAAEMRQAIAKQAETQERTRASIRGVLKNSQVRATAARLGLDVTNAERAVATLSNDELNQLAGPVNDLARELAGGSQTIVLSTTTLLLIIIIVILLAK